MAGNMADDPRLAAARAKIKDIEGRRAARAAAQAVEQEIAAAEREAKDLEAIEAAECEHGQIGREIAVINTPDMGCVILKRAHSLLFRRFQDEGKFTTTAIDKLIGPSRVHPSTAEFEAILDRYPAKRAECADAFCELAGARSAEQAKKS